MRLKLLLCDKTFFGEVGLLLDLKYYFVSIKEKVNCKDCLPVKHNIVLNIPLTIVVPLVSSPMLARNGPKIIPNAAIGTTVTI